ncbi:MAG TPA: cell wall hydrolase [Bacilli bacterium]|nr:cell wall hydrolase [Bacilli bacterium]
MIIKYTTKEKELLARLMRAEALGEGNLGMLMVGNVIVNRALAGCLTFTNIRTITDVIYQNPGGFTGINSPLFIGTPTTKELDLAERVLRGEYYYPATNALWFYSPAEGNPCVSYWYEQKNSGRYKNHCFYVPYSGVCKEIH